MNQNTRIVVKTGTVLTEERDSGKPWGRQNKLTISDAYSKSTSAYFVSIVQTR